MHRQFRRALTSLSTAAIMAIPSGYAWAAPPLITEDTGTQGRGNWQLEVSHDSYTLHNERAHTREREFKAVLSYGVQDNVDLMLALPYLRVTDRNDANASARGWGDAEIAAKWRFFDDGPLSIALRPGLALPTGDKGAGLSSERYIPSVFGILSYVPGAWGVHMHAGYTHNFHAGPPQRRHIWHASLAAQYSASEALRWVIDVSAETNPAYDDGPRLASAVLGMIFSPKSDVDISLGYRRGLTDATPDHSLLMGLTLRF